MRVGEKRRVTLEDLAKVAAGLLTVLPRLSVLWLSGELGSGKTAFAKALTEAAGASGASSPTFSLVNEYQCPTGVIFHADCYRLKSFEEALDLDFPEILKSARLLMIEWPERAGHYAPQPDLSLRFSHADEPSVRLLERVL